MKKAFVAAIILLSSFFAKQATAQTLFVGVYGGSQVSGVDVADISCHVKSSQRISPGVTDNLDNDVSFFIGGPGSEPIANLYYWVTPSISTVLTFSIASGYTVDVDNTNATSVTVRVSVTYDPFVGAQTGTYVTIPANSTGTLSVPVGGFSYTSTAQFGSNDPIYGYPFPVRIEVTL